jgi:exonuclease III
VYLPRFY